MAVPGTGVCSRWLECLTPKLHAIDAERRSVWVIDTLAKPPAAYPSTWDTQQMQEKTCVIPIFKSRVEKRDDPDQLALQKPADLDLLCFQNRRYLGLAR